MDKLIKLGVEAKLNETMIQRIETLCYNGSIDSGKALDLIVQQNERFTKRWKEILNEVDKTYVKQFMQDRTFEALNIN